jgi:hypothetical protein
MWVFSHNSSTKTPRRKHFRLGGIDRLLSGLSNALIFVILRKKILLLEAICESMTSSLGHEQFEFHRLVTFSTGFWQQDHLYTLWTPFKTLAFELFTWPFREVVLSVYILVHCYSVSHHFSICFRHNFLNIYQKHVLFDAIDRLLSGLSNALIFVILRKKILLLQAIWIDDVITWSRTIWISPPCNFFHSALSEAF